MAPALGDGVERAVGRNGPTFDLDLAYYADLYASSAPGKGMAEVAVDNDMIEFFEKVEGEVVDEEPPSELNKTGHARNYFELHPLISLRLKGANIGVAAPVRGGWEDRRYGLLLPLPRRPGSAGRACS